MNALAGYLYRHLRDNGWSIDDLVRRSGLSPAGVRTLLDPTAEELSGLPDRDTVVALARALGVPRTEVVLKAAEACGLATGRMPYEAPTLHTATNHQLVRELRRRLAQGARSSLGPQRRLGHLTAIDGALAEAW
jgi:hypothetical protein